MIREIKNGKIRGKIINGKIVCFAGIPYATPPVNSLRWREPQPLENWSGIKDCTSYTHSAYQSAAEEWRTDIPTPYGKEFNIRKEETPSEDCLYLNVWMPINALEQEEKLPVLCIIHGGGFESGSGGIPVLEGTNLANEGIVVVTVNYRLGIFGFFAHPELTEESPLHTSGNYELLDQICALHWIQDNIGSFGGDFEKVTVSGESAGSISVNALYESPLAKGLFSKAIAQSGAHIGKDTYCPQMSLKEAEIRGVSYLKGLSADSIEDLRKMPTEEIFAGSWGFLPFRDGIIWPENSYKIFSGHRQNDVPLLLGSNSHEGSIFAFNFMREDYSLRFMEQAKKRYKEDADVFFELYPIENKEKASYFMGMAYGEKLFAYSIYLWATLQNDYGKSDIYYYYFDRVLPETAEYGAYHSSVLPYFYDTMAQSEKKWEDVDWKLKDTMFSYIVNFVKSGTPNGTDLPHWNTFSQNITMTMELGNHVGMIEHPSMEMFGIYMKHDYKETSYEKSSLN